MTFFCLLATSFSKIKYHILKKKERQEGEIQFYSHKKICFIETNKQIYYINNNLDAVNFFYWLLATQIYLAGWNNQS